MKLQTLGLAANLLVTLTIFVRQVFGIFGLPGLIIRCCSQVACFSVEERLSAQPGQEVGRVRKLLSSFASAGLRKASWSKRRPSADRLGWEGRFSPLADVRPAGILHDWCHRPWTLVGGA